MASKFTEFFREQRCIFTLRYVYTVSEIWKTKFQRIASLVFLPKSTHTTGTPDTLGGSFDTRFAIFRTLPKQPNLVQLLNSLLVPCGSAVSKQQYAVPSPLASLSSFVSTRDRSRRQRAKEVRPLHQKCLLLWHRRSWCSKLQ